MLIKNAIIKIIPFLLFIKACASVLPAGADLETGELEREHLYFNPTSYLMISAEQQLLLFFDAEITTNVTK